MHVHVICINMLSASFLCLHIHVVSCWNRKKHTDSTCTIQCTCTLYMWTSHLDIGFSLQSSISKLCHCDAISHLIPRHTQWRMACACTLHNTLKPLHTVTLVGLGVNRCNNITTRKSQSDRTPYWNIQVHVYTCTLTISIQYRCTVKTMPSMFSN